MGTHSIFVVIAAAALAAASFPALSKDSGQEGAAPDQGRRAPHARPDERVNPQQQTPRRGVFGRDQGPPEADRPARRDHAQPESHRRDHPRPHADHRPGDHRHGDHRHTDRRHWVNPIPDHRHFGYVLPRPSYHGVPRVYYTPPVAYYSAPPSIYYQNPAPALVLQPGDYLPPEFRSQQFVVTDWEWRGLSAPAYGYQWMLLGPDNFALVALSTGQIVALVATR